MIYGYEALIVPLKVYKTLWKAFCVYLDMKLLPGKQRNKMCLWNTKAPDDGQFQRWPRSQGHIFWYQCKDLVTRNDRVQYGSSNIYILEVRPMSIFKKMVKCQGQKVSTNKNGQMSRSKG